MGEVDGTLLAKARNRLDWTQDALSRNARVNVTTISRIERGKAKSVRRGTLNRLCEALKVRPSELARDPSPEPERDLMKIRMGSAARNALALVAHRYRVPRDRVVEIAPLLFFLVAEASFNARRHALQVLRAAADSVYGAAIPHLPRHAAVDEDALQREEGSIEKRDLFGVTVDEGGFAYDEADFDSKTGNPFARFLNRMMREANGGQETADVEWDRGGSPNYRVCENEALQLTGNDGEAADAILSGFASLHEMPKRLTPAERAAWAKAERNDWFAAADEIMSSLANNGGQS